MSFVQQLALIEQLPCTLCFFIAGHVLLPFSHHHRERELAKMAEEKALEREAARIASERHRRERELAAREAVEAAQRKKEAIAA